jgi:hypothetical protein
MKKGWSGGVVAGQGRRRHRAGSLNFPFLKKFLIQTIFSSSSFRFSKQISKTNHRFRQIYKRKPHKKMNKTLLFFPLLDSVRLLTSLSFSVSARPHSLFTKTGLILLCFGSVLHLYNYFSVALDFLTNLP